MKDRKKSILITGCSSGIGLETAKYLSQNGWQVFATCRKKEDVKKISSLDINCFHLDYNSDKRIKSLRMASMVIAIERIAESYVSLGI